MDETNESAKVQRTPSAFCRLLPWVAALGVTVVRLVQGSRGEAAGDASRTMWAGETGGRVLEFRQVG